MGRKTPQPTPPPPPPSSVPPDFTSLTRQDVEHRLHLAERRLSILQASMGDERGALFPPHLAQVVLEAIPAFIWLKDKRNRIIAANRAALELAGLSPEEAKNRPATEFAPEPAEEFWQHDREVLTTGKPRLGILEPVVRRDGSTIWVRTDKMPLRDSAGNLSGVIAFSVDITEQMNAELGLRDKERLFESVLEATHDTVWEWDVATGFYHVSDRWLEMLGYSRDEFTPHISSFETLVHPADLDAVRHRIQLHLQGKLPDYICEHRIRRKEGTWATVLARGRVLSREGDGSPLRMVGTNIDRSGQVAAEEALQQTQTRYQRIVDMSQDGIWLLDADWHTTFANDRLGILLGCPSASLPGRSAHEFLAEESVPVLQELSRNRDAVHRDVRLRRADGTGRWAIVSLTVLQRLDGSVDGYLAMLTDITERREAEERIQKAQRMAEAAAKARGEFIANVSHEIRTPMNAVIGLTALLMDTPLNEEQRDLVSTIRQSSEVLLTVINDILDFSKADVGRMELERVPLSVRACVEEVCDLLAARAHQKGLELNMFVHPQVPRRVIGDPMRLRQILMNLVSNGIKFTDHGSVSLEVTNLGPREDRSMLRFAIRDTGIGIPEDQVSKLFQPFSQVDPSTTKRFGGTGLGLAISRQLAQLMGGTLSVTSTLGHGSTFALELAVSQPAEEGSSRLEYLPTHLRNMQVLVVSNDPADLAFTQAKLQQIGARAESAENATVAIERLAPSGGPPVNLVLLSDSVGEHQAEALGKRLKSDASLGCPKVVLMAKTTGASRALREGGAFDAHVLKPVKPGNLMRVLAQVIDPRSTKYESQVEVMKLPSADASSEHRRMLRILLAEDNLVNQRVAVMILRRAGYACDLVPNGREAVNACLKADYDLIFMDCMMPEMDGFEATAEIRRKIRDRKRPVVVAMTAAALEQDRERCYAAGMDAFLSKPVQPGDILEVIQRYFPDPAHPAPG